MIFEAFSCMKYIPCVKLSLNQEKAFFSKFESSDPTECWNWIGSKNIEGRGRFQISGKIFFAPRVSYYLFYGIDPGEFQVNHTCDNPSCINPDHLYLGNQSDNMKDCAIKKRLKINPGFCSGENHYQSKLSDSDVEKIKSLKGKMKHKEIAKLFNISRSHVSGILSGQQRIN